MSEPDDRMPVSGPVARERLVQWVYETPDLQENEALEWKRGYDLSSRPGAAQTAKHLIGFANRDPTAAQRKYGGHAYLLLGVEPGNVPGVETWDSADIERWLQVFVEPELRYDIFSVRCDDQHVLLFEVDAPQAGDPIFALQQSTADDDGRALREATVFVRKRGMTEQPSHAELKNLQRRLAARPPRSLDFHLELRGQGPSTMPPDMFTAEHRDAHLGSLLEGYLDELPPPSPGGILGRATSGLESRSPREFNDEVREFIRNAEENWSNFYGAFLAQENPAWVHLAIANDGDSGYEAVAVEVDLPLPRWGVHADAGAAKDALQPPELPLRWGQSYPEDLDSLFESPVRVEEVSDNTTRVHLPRLDVRPRTRHPLERFLVLLSPQLAGEELTARWRATARGLDGDQAGEVVIPVRGTS